ncbi:MAG: putative metal-binding motif-containing protein, partial [Polyangiales bacterium]
MGRLSWLAVLAFAACDSGPNEGAILTFDTPDGPMTATRLEVVLANSAEDAISDVDNQRREPGSGEDDAVRYYRQRAVGGTIEGSTGLTGFQLRIEPDMTTSTDESFIPFVFAYDTDRLIGVGAIEDENGDPTHAQITPGVVTKYTITMGAVQALDSADAAVERGMARVVSCSRRTDGGGEWKSGVAWFPIADTARPNGRAHQLRLLLPDVSTDAMATDATTRAADLDCDAHPADKNDCDDLRGAFYNGAAESCDGLDTNCDSQRYMARSCVATNTTCSVGPAATGVQICDDDAGTYGACSACMCAPSGGSTSCISCTVDFTGTTASAKAACSPSVGKILLPMCEDSGCTVEVATATNGWNGYISTLETGGFTT